MRLADHRPTLSRLRRLHNRRVDAALARVAGARTALTAARAGVDAHAARVRALDDQQAALGDWIAEQIAAGSLRLMACARARAEALAHDRDAALADLAKAREAAEAAQADLTDAIARWTRAEARRGGIVRLAKDYDRQQAHEREIVDLDGLDDLSATRCHVTD